MKYRNKPVVIEALQFHNDSSSYELIHWVNDGQHANGRPFASWHNSTMTIGGDTASLGDWIIHGVEGEFYSCKPDIFDLTYEPA